MTSSKELSPAIKRWGLLDKGFGYDVVAVFGSQSTGKSEWSRFFSDGKRGKGRERAHQAEPFLPSSFPLLLSFFLPQAHSSTDSSGPASMSWTRRLVNRRPRVCSFPQPPSSLVVNGEIESEPNRRSLPLSSQVSGCARPRSTLSWSWT